MRLATARGMVGSASPRSARLPSACPRPPCPSTRVWKSYRLYHERNQYLKAAILKRPAGPLRGVLGAQGRRRSRCRPGRRSASSGRTARARARCSSASPGSSMPEKGGVDGQRPDLGAARARRRVPPRAERSGERVPQRRHPRAVEEGDQRPASTTSSSSPGSRSSSTRRSRTTRRACSCGSASPSPPTSSPRCC